jgi:hypothetical protein
VACFQAPISGLVYPTSNDARYTTGEPKIQKSVVVHYPLHPLYGRGDLLVCRRRGVGNLEHVEVEIDQQQQAIPRWMTDEKFCQRLTIGHMPQVSLTALLELLSLLDATPL